MIIASISVFTLTLALALGMAFLIMTLVEKKARTYVGPWYIILPNEGHNNGMYTRAWYTLTALFGLKKDEQIYFVAETDHTGAPLKAEADYLVRGGSLDCRWWNITVYGQDRYLIKHPENRYSFSNFDLLDNNKDRYEFQLSSKQKKGHWLFTGRKGNRFSLMLRINNPPRHMIDRPGEILLPEIRRKDL